MDTTHRCDLCHTWRTTPGRCQQIACLACGTVQCHSNGTARGCCKACYFGRLPGWSFNYVPATCQYTGCTAPNVYAFLPGSKKHCCKHHGDQIIARRKR
jgi:hypothetical protein